MAKFMELTLQGSKQKITVNADKVVKYWQPEGSDYTVIEFDGGGTITVKESTTDIWNAGYG